MAFNYDPKDASDCLPEGSYDAILLSVTEKRSSKGNDMLEIIWCVPINGKDWKVRDYIVNPSTLFKLKQIAKAWHMAKEFEERTFDLAEHVNRPIRLKLEVEISSAYGDKNAVAGYEETTGPAPVLQGAPPDKDIPF